MIYGRRRLCWKRGGHGWVDVEKALAYSCNVFFYKLGKELGIDAINDYGKQFGLGRLRAESTCRAKNGHPAFTRVEAGHASASSGIPGDTISVAIGQGLLAVTPVQMARMMSAVGHRRQIGHAETDGGDEPSEDAHELEISQVATHFESSCSGRCVWRSLPDGTARRCHAWRVHRRRERRGRPRSTNTRPGSTRTIFPRTNGTTRGSSATRRRTIHRSPSPSSSSTEDTAGRRPHRSRASVLEVYYSDPPVQKRRTNGLRAAAVQPIEAEDVRTPATR